MARILAVDDSASIRFLIATALKEVGHVVEVANDGVEGLEQLRAGKFDLVITDLNMPRMNGLDFIAALRATNRFTPVLVLTTEVNPQLKEAAKAAGATGWLVKPFQVEPFCAVVKRLVS